MNIEKRPVEDIQKSTHLIVEKYIDESSQLDTQLQKDELVAQYLDMMFRAGWESYKQLNK